MTTSSIPQLEETREERHRKFIRFIIDDTKNLADHINAVVLARQKDMLNHHEFSAQENFDLLGAESSMHLISFAKKLKEVLESYDPSAYPNVPADLSGITLQ